MTSMDSNWVKTTMERAAIDRQRLDEARRRLQDLEREVAQLAERVRSWEVILESVNLTLKPTTLEEAAKPQATLLPEDESQMGETYAGLRDAIRAVLKGVGARGLRPRDVTRTLQRQGFKAGGDSELSIRVGNEMWRMHKRKMLKKEGALYYMP
jgi:hypothetical protein